MKKIIAICLLLTSLQAVAFDDTGKEIFPPIVPDGLKDCKFYQVLWSTGLLTFKNLTVTRCPSSSTNTSYVENKNQHNVTVIDEENEKAAREAARTTALNKLTDAEKDLLGVKK